GAEAAELGEPYVVEHDDHDVGRAPRRPLWLGPTRRRLVVVAPDHPAKRLIPHRSPLSRCSRFSCTAVPLRSPPLGRGGGVSTYPDALHPDVTVLGTGCAVTRARRTGEELPSARTGPLPHVNTSGKPDSLPQLKPPDADLG